MIRITVDVNDEWLDAAWQVLGTDTKVATINEALRMQAMRIEAAQIVEAFDGVPMDFSGSVESFGYGVVVTMIVRRQYTDAEGKQNLRGTDPASFHRVICARLTATVTATTAT